MVIVPRRRRDDGIGGWAGFDGSGGGAVVKPAGSPEAPGLRGATKKGRCALTLAMGKGRVALALFRLSPPLAGRRRRAPSLR